MIINPKTPIDAFHVRLQAKRLELNLIQKYVAKKVGITTRCLQQYESGERVPRVPELVRLCRTLKTTPNELLGFE